MAQEKTVEDNVTLQSPSIGTTKPRTVRFFQCESCCNLTLELNSPIDVHQGPSDVPGISYNFFVHLLTLHNHSPKRVRVNSVSSQYLSADGEWLPTTRTSLATYTLDENGMPAFDCHNGFRTFDVEGNSSSDLAVSCVIEFQGTPSTSPFERNMAHSSFPQPLHFRVLVTQSDGRQAKLLTEQINPVLLQDDIRRQEVYPQRQATVTSASSRDRYGEDIPEEVLGAQVAAADAEMEYKDWARRKDAMVQMRQFYQQQARDEAAEREKLYQELQATRGNVAVVIRVRPLLVHERTTDDPRTDPNFLPSFPTKDQIVLRTDRRHGRHGRNLHFYACDRVFGPEATQHDVYMKVQPMALSVIDGYNVCIMVYGQTGSGKTYTMSGPEDGSQTPGLMFSILKELCDIKSVREARQSSWPVTYDISLAVMEIYNEKLFDLLLPSQQVRDKCLEIRKAPNGDTYIKDLTEATANTFEEMLPLLQRGMHNRSVGVSNVNVHSSRSHCVVKVHVCSHNLLSSEETHATLFLVDLAGSERITKSGPNHSMHSSPHYYHDLMTKRLHLVRETQHINKSLAALGDVIEALVNQRSFVPYRNSKLTYLLQNCLDGGARVAVIITVSPTEDAMQETLSSLMFAARVARVHLPEQDEPEQEEEVVVTPREPHTPTHVKSPSTRPVTRKNAQQMSHDFNANLD